MGSVVVEDAAVLHPKDLRALSSVGNGTFDDRAAFVAADALDRLIYIPKADYTFSSPFAVDAGAFLPDPRLTWDELTDGGAFDLVRGHFTGAVTGANIWRFADRVFIGEAASKFAGASAGMPDAGTSYFSDESISATYLGVNASLLVISPDRADSGGRYAVVGAARLSANTGTANSAIGVAGAVDVNYASGRGWAGYFDTQLQAHSYGYGIEISVRNCSGSGAANTVYSGSAFGGVGILLSGGGDPSLQVAATHPSNTAIIVGRQNAGLSAGWYKGICFNASGLVTDGNGIATAIEMPRAYSVTWLANDATGNPAARIYSDATDSTKVVKQIFQNDQLLLQAANGNPIALFVHNTNGANYLRMYNIAAGGSPRLLAAGSDTDIGIIHSTKGLGGHNFYTHSLTVVAVVIDAVASANDYLRLKPGVNGTSVPTLYVGGQTNVPLTIQTKGSGTLKLDPASGDIQWGKALVALGGGAAPTLGTIGGSGPATAAQNTWLRLLDSAGNACWVPVWK